MKDLLNLCLFLVIVMKCTGLDCPTCQGLECLKSRIPKLKCQKDYPTLPFQVDLPQGRTNGTSQYGCIALQYYTGKTSYIINQCFPVIPDNCICERLKQAVHVKQCTFSGGENQRNKWNINIDCEKNKRDNNKTNKTKDEDRIRQGDGSEQQYKQKEKGEKEMTEKEKKEKEKKNKEKEEKDKKEAQKTKREREKQVKEPKISLENKTKEGDSKINEEETETGKQMETDQNIDEQNNGSYFSSVINIVSWLAGNFYQTGSETLIKDSQLGTSSDTVNSITLAENTKLIQSSPYQATTVNSFSFESATLATLNSSVTKTNNSSKNPWTPTPNILAEYSSAVKLINSSKKYSPGKTATKPSNILTEAPKGVKIVATEVVPLLTANTTSSSNNYTSNISSTKQSSMLNELQKITSNIITKNSTLPPVYVSNAENNYKNKNTALAETQHTIADVITNTTFIPTIMKYGTDEKISGRFTTQSTVSMGIQKATTKRESNAPSIITAISSSKHNKSTVNATQQHDVSTNIQKGATIEIADVSVLSIKSTTSAGYNNEPSPPKQNIMTTKTQKGAASVITDYLPVETTANKNYKTPPTAQKGLPTKTETVATSVTEAVVALPTINPIHVGEIYVDNKNVITEPNNLSNQTQKPATIIVAQSLATTEAIGDNNNTVTTRKIINIADNIKNTQREATRVITEVSTLKSIVSKNYKTDQNPVTGQAGTSARTQKVATSVIAETVALPTVKTTDAGENYVNNKIIFTKPNNKSNQAQKPATLLIEKLFTTTETISAAVTTDGLYQEINNNQDKNVEASIPHPIRIKKDCTNPPSWLTNTFLTKESEYSSTPNYDFSELNTILNPDIRDLSSKTKDATTSKIIFGTSCNPESNGILAGTLSMPQQSIPSPEKSIAAAKEEIKVIKVDEVVNVANYSPTKKSETTIVSPHASQQHYVPEKLLPSIIIKESTSAITKQKIENTLEEIETTEGITDIKISDTSVKGESVTTSRVNLAANTQQTIQTISDKSERLISNPVLEISAKYTSRVHSKIDTSAKEPQQSTEQLVGTTKNIEIFKINSTSLNTNRSEIEYMKITTKTIFLPTPSDSKILRSTLFSEIHDNLSEEESATISLNLNIYNHEPQSAGTSTEMNALSYSQEDNENVFKLESLDACDENDVTTTPHFTETISENDDNFSKGISSDLADTFSRTSVIAISSSSLKENKNIFKSETSLTGDLNSVISTLSNTEQTLDIGDDILNSTPNSKSMNAFPAEDTVTISTNLGTIDYDIEKKAGTRSEQPSWSTSEYSETYENVITSDMTDTSFSNDEDDTLSSKSSIQILEGDKFLLNTESSFVFDKDDNKNFKVVGVTTQNDETFSNDKSSDLADTFPIMSITTISSSSLKEKKNVFKSETSGTWDFNSIVSTSSNTEQTSDNGDDMLKSTLNSKSLDAFTAEDTATISTNLDTIYYDIEEKTGTRSEQPSWSTSEYSETYENVITSDMTDTSVSSAEDDTLSSTSSIQILDGDNFLLNTESSFVSNEDFDTNFKVVDVTTENDDTFSNVKSSDLADTFPRTSMTTVSSSSLKEKKNVFKSDTSATWDLNSVISTPTNTEQTLDNGDDMLKSTLNSKSLDAFTAEDTAPMSTNLNTIYYDIEEKTGTRSEQPSWSKSEYSETYENVLTSDMTDTSVSCDEDDTLSSTSSIQILDGDNFLFNTESSFVSNEDIDTNFKVVDVTTENDDAFLNVKSSDLADTFPRTSITTISSSSLKEKKNVFKSDTSATWDLSSVISTPTNTGQTLDNGDDILKSKLNSKSMDAFPSEDTATIPSNLNNIYYDIEEKTGTSSEQPSWSTSEYSDTYENVIISEITDTSISSDEDNTLSSKSSIQILEEGNFLLNTESKFVSDKDDNENFKVVGATTQNDETFSNDKSSDLADTFPIMSITTISSSSLKEKKNVFKSETSGTWDLNFIISTSSNTEQTLDNGDDMLKSTLNSKSLDAFTAEDTARISTNLNTIYNDIEEKTGTRSEQPSWSTSEYSETYENVITSDMTDTSVSSAEDDTLSSTSSIQILDGDNFLLNTESSFVSYEDFDTNFKVVDVTTENDDTFSNAISSDLTDAFPRSSITTISSSSLKEKKNVFKSETSGTWDLNSILSTSSNTEQTLDNGDDMLKSALNSKSLDAFTAEDTATISTNLNTIYYDIEEKTGTRSEQPSWSMSKYSETYENVITSDMTDTSVSSAEDDTLSSTSSIQILDGDNFLLNTESSFVSNEDFDTNFKVVDVTTANDDTFSNGKSSDLADTFPRTSMTTVSSSSLKEKKNVFKSDTSATWDLNSVISTPTNTEQPLDNGDDMLKSTPNSKSLDAFTAEDTAPMSTNLNTIYYDIEEKTGTRSEQPSWSTSEYSETYENVITSDMTDTSVSSDEDDTLSSTSSIQILDGDNFLFNTESSFVSNEDIDTNFKVVDVTTENDDAFLNVKSSDLADTFPRTSITTISSSSLKEKKNVFKSDTSATWDLNSVISTPTNTGQTLDNGDDSLKSKLNSKSIDAFPSEDTATIPSNLNNIYYDIEEKTGTSSEQPSWSTSEYSDTYENVITSEITDTSISSNEDDILSSKSSIQILDGGNFLLNTESSFVSDEDVDTNFKVVGVTAENDDTFLNVKSSDLADTFPRTSITTISSSSLKEKKNVFKSETSGTWDLNSILSTSSNTEQTLDNGDDMLKSTLNSKSLDAFTAEDTATISTNLDTIYYDIEETTGTRSEQPSWSTSEYSETYEHVITSDMTDTSVFNDEDDALSTSSIQILDGDNFLLNTESSFVSNEDFDTNFKVVDVTTENDDTLSNVKSSDLADTFPRTSMTTISASSLKEKKNVFKSETSGTWDLNPIISTSSNTEQTLDNGDDMLKSTLNSKSLDAFTAEDTAPMSTNLNTIYYDIEEKTGTRSEQPSWSTSEYSETYLNVITSDMTDTSVSSDEDDTLSSTSSIQILDGDNFLFNTGSSFVSDEDIDTNFKVVDVTTENDNTFLNVKSSDLADTFPRTSITTISSSSLKEKKNVFKSETSDTWDLNSIISTSSNTEQTLDNGDDILKSTLNSKSLDAFTAEDTATISTNLDTIYYDIEETTGTGSEQPSWSTSEHSETYENVITSDMTDTSVFNDEDDALSTSSIQALDGDNFLLNTESSFVSNEDLDTNFKVVDVTTENDDTFSNVKSSDLADTFPRTSMTTISSSSLKEKKNVFKSETSGTWDLNSIISTSSNTEQTLDNGDDMLKSTLNSKSLDAFTAEDTAPMSTNLNTIYYDIEEKTGTRSEQPSWSTSEYSVTYENVITSEITDTSISSDEDDILSSKSSIQILEGGNFPYNTESSFVSDKDDNKNFKVVGVTTQNAETTPTNTEQTLDNGDDSLKSKFNSKSMDAFPSEDTATIPSNLNNIYYDIEEKTGTSSEQPSWSTSEYSDTYENVITSEITDTSISSDEDDILSSKSSIQILEGGNFLLNTESSFVSDKDDNKNFKVVGATTQNDETFSNDKSSDLADTFPIMYITTISSSSLKEKKNVFKSETSGTWDLNSILSTSSNPEQTLDNGDDMFKSTLNSKSLDAFTAEDTATISTNLDTIYYDIEEKTGTRSEQPSWSTSEYSETYENVITSDMTDTSVSNDEDDTLSSTSSIQILDGDNFLLNTESSFVSDEDFDTNFKVVDVTTENDDTFSNVKSSDLADTFPRTSITTISSSFLKEKKNVFKSDTSATWDLNSVIGTPTNTEQILDNGDDMLKSTLNSKSLDAFTAEDTVTISTNLNTIYYDIEEKTGTRSEQPSWSTSEYSETYKNVITSDMTDTSVSSDEDDTLSSTSSIQILDGDNFLFNMESSFVSDEDIDTYFKVVDVTTENDDTFLNVKSSDLADTFPRTSITTISSSSLKEKKNVFKSETSGTWDLNSILSTSSNIEQTLDNGDMFKSTLNSKSLDAFTAEDTATISTNLDTIYYDIEEKTGTRSEQPSWSTSEYSETYEHVITSDMTDTSVSNDEDDTLSSTSSIQILDGDNFLFNMESSFVSDEDIDTNFKVVDVTTENDDTFLNVKSSDLADTFPRTSITTISSSSLKEKKNVFKSETSGTWDLNSILSTSSNTEQTLDNGDDMFKSTLNSKSLDAFTAEDTATISTNLDTIYYDIEEKTGTRSEQPSWSMSEYSETYENVITSDMTDTSVSNDEDDTLSSTSSIQILDGDNFLLNTESSFVSNEDFHTNFKVVDVTTENDDTFSNVKSSDLADTFPRTSMTTISSSSLKEKKNVFKSDTSATWDLNSVISTPTNTEQTLDNGDDSLKSKFNSKSIDAFPSEDTATIPSNLNNIYYYIEEKTGTSSEQPSWSTSEYSDTYENVITSEITDTSISSDEDDILSSKSSIQILEGGNFLLKTESSFVSDKDDNKNFKVVVATTQNDETFSNDKSSDLADTFPIMSITTISSSSLKEKKNVFKSETSGTWDLNSIISASSNTEQTLDNGDDMFKSTFNSKSLDAFTAEDTATISTNLDKIYYDIEEKSGTRSEQPSWSTSEYSETYENLITSDMTDTSVSNDEDDTLSSTSSIQILDGDNFLLNTESSFVSDEDFDTNFKVVDVTTENDDTFSNLKSSDLADTFPRTSITTISSSSLKEKKNVFKSDTSATWDLNSVIGTPTNTEQTLDNGDDMLKSTLNSKSLDAFTAEDTATISTNLNTIYYDIEEKTGTRSEQPSWSTSEYSETDENVITSDMTDTSVSSDEDDTLSSTSSIQILDGDNFLFNTEFSFVSDEDIDTNFKVVDVTTENDDTFLNLKSSDLADTFPRTSITTISSSSLKEKKNVFKSETSGTWDLNSILSTSSNTEQTLDNGDDMLTSTLNSKSLDAFTAEDTATISTNLDTIYYDIEEKTGTRSEQPSWSTSEYSETYENVITSDMTDTSVSNDEDDTLSSTSSIPILDGDNFLLNTESSFVSNEDFDTNFKVVDVTTENDDTFSNVKSSDLADTFPRTSMTTISSSSLKEKKNIFKSDTSATWDLNSVISTPTNTEQTLDNVDDSLKSKLNSKSIDAFPSEDTATIPSNLNNIYYDIEEKIGTSSEQPSWSTSEYSDTYENVITSVITDTSISSDEDDIILSSKSSIQILEGGNFLLNTESSFVSDKDDNKNFKVVGVTTQNAETTPTNTEQTLDNGDDILENKLNSKTMGAFPSEDTATIPSNLNNIYYDIEEKTGNSSEQPSWSTSEYSDTYENVMTSEITDTSISSNEDNTLSSKSSIEILEEGNFLLNTESSLVSDKDVNENFKVVGATTQNDETFSNDKSSDLADTFPIMSITTISSSSLKEKKNVFKSETSGTWDLNSIISASSNTEQTLYNGDDMLKSTFNSKSLDAFTAEDTATISTNLNTIYYDIEEKTGTKSDQPSWSTSEDSETYENVITSDMTDTSVSKDEDETLSSTSSKQIIDGDNFLLNTDSTFVSDEDVDTNFKVVDVTTENYDTFSNVKSSDLADAFPRTSIATISSSSLKENIKVFKSDTSATWDLNSVTSTPPNTEQTLENGDDILESTLKSKNVNAFLSEDTATIPSNLNNIYYNIEEKTGTSSEQPSWSTSEYSERYENVIASDITGTSVSNDEDDTLSSKSSIQILEGGNFLLNTESSFVSDKDDYKNVEVVSVTTQNDETFSNDKFSDLADTFPIMSITTISSSSLKEKKNVFKSETSGTWGLSSIISTSSNTEQTLDNSDDMLKSTLNSKSLDAFTAEDTATISTNLDTIYYDIEEKRGTRSEKQSWSTSEYIETYENVITSDMTDISVSNDEDDTLSSTSSKQIIDGDNFLLNTDSTFVSDEDVDTNFKDVTTENYDTFSNVKSSDPADTFPRTSITTISSSSLKEKKNGFKSDTSATWDLNSVISTPTNTEQTFDNGDDILKSILNSKSLDAFTAEDTATISTTLDTFYYDIEEKTGTKSDQPSWSTSEYSETYENVITSDMTDTSVSKDEDETLSSTSSIPILEGDNFLLNTESSCVSDKDVDTNFKVVDVTTENDDTFSNAISSDLADAFPRTSITTISSSSLKENKKVFKSDTSATWDLNSVTSNPPNTEQTLENGDDILESTLKSNSVNAFPSEDTATIPSNLNNTYYDIEEKTGTSSEQPSWSTSEYSETYKNVIASDITGTSVSNDEDDTLSSKSSIQILEKDNFLLNTESSLVSNTIVDTNFEVIKGTTENDMIFTKGISLDPIDKFSEIIATTISSSSSRENINGFQSDSSVIWNTNSVKSTTPNIEQALDNGDILKSTPNSNRLDGFSAGDTATISTNLDTNDHETEEKTDLNIYYLASANLLFETWPSLKAEQTVPMNTKQPPIYLNQDNSLFNLDLGDTTSKMSTENIESTDQPTLDYSTTLKSVPTLEFLESTEPTGAARFSSKEQNTYSYDSENILFETWPSLRPENSVSPYTKHSVAFTIGNTENLKEISISETSFITNVFEQENNKFKSDFSTIFQEKFQGNIDEIPESTSENTGQILASSFKKNSASTKKLNIFDRENELLITSEPNTEITEELTNSAKEEIADQPLIGEDTIAATQSKFEQNIVDLASLEQSILTNSKQNIESTSNPTIDFEKVSTLETTLEGNDIFKKDISFTSEQTIGSETENTDIFEEKVSSENIFISISDKTDTVNEYHAEYSLKPEEIIPTNTEQSDRLSTKHNYFILFSSKTLPPSTYTYEVSPIAKLVTKDIENPTPSPLLEGKISTSIPETNDGLHSESIDTASPNQEIHDTPLYTDFNEKVSSTMSTIEAIKTSIENPKTTSATVGEISGPRSTTDPSTLFPEEPKIASTDIIDTISLSVAKMATDRTISTRETPEESYTSTDGTDETFSNIWTAETTNTILEIHISASDITTTGTIFGAISSAGLTKSSDTIPETSRVTAITTGKVVNNLEQTTETSSKATKTSSIVTGTTEKTFGSKSTTQPTKSTQKGLASTIIEVTTENSLPEISNGCDYDMISGSLHPIPFSFIYFLTLFVAILNNL